MAPKSHNNSEYILMNPTNPSRLRIVIITSRLTTQLIQPHQTELLVFDHHTHFGRLPLLFVEMILLFQ